jgi:homoserine dehydrogenase
LVKAGDPLAEVRGAYNAISVVGDAVGRVFFHGQGAGQMPTASAVVADMIDTAVGRTRLTFKTLGLWSQREARVGIRAHEDLKGRFYLRFIVEDHPGVMAQITGVLGRQNVSIASVIQHESDQTADGSQVPLVIMTHMTTEGATAASVREIEQLPCVHQVCVRIRVLD